MASIVYMLAAARHRGFSTSVLLLAGVTLNSFFSALILLVQYFADMTSVDADAAMAARRPRRRQLHGRSSWRCRCWPWRSSSSSSLAPSLNLLSVGDDCRGDARRRRRAHAAHRVSQRVARHRRRRSIGGPIGFVGIIVPHLVRLVVGPDHRLVLPASLGFGAAFLVACDLVARTVIAPLELPVGIVTAVIGGPFFLWLLVKNA